MAPGSPMRCSYDRGLDRLASLPQLRQVDIKRFPHFGPDETEQLLQVRLRSMPASNAGNCMRANNKCYHVTFARCRPLVRA